MYKGWFTEFSPDDLARQEYSEREAGKKVMKVDGEEICALLQRSKYQDVLVFKSETYGNVLVLDGVIQTTDRDEFAYQEMLAHLPLFAHPNPKKVLIIGGGDGGILREAVKHPSVESVTMCEIDEMVVEVAKKHLPNLSKAFSHPKLNLYIGDGFEFLKGHKEQFDVVITDSSDPESLREGGILSSQGECIWLHLPLITKLVSLAKGLFPNVRYAYSSMPTYPSGSMGYLLASKDKSLDLSVPARKLSEKQVEESRLNFYNSQIHSAAFVLPTFVAKALESANEGTS
uniref:PABS domain-containing protein n=1 Tax=Ditylenchus dipsaci TaxID=166011 RepID=A0A915CN45_9BILA